MLKFSWSVVPSIEFPNVFQWSLTNCIDISNMLLRISLRAISPIDDWLRKVALFGQLPAGPAEPDPYLICNGQWPWVKLNLPGDFGKVSFLTSKEESERSLQIRFYHNRFETLFLEDLPSSPEVDKELFQVEEEKGWHLVLLAKTHEGNKFPIFKKFPSFAQNWGYKYFEIFYPWKTGLWFK